MGIYVKKLKTNVKQKQTVTLGEKTLIVGKNGSGKSSILNSLELCFGGYVSDYRGKVVRNQQDLLRLAVDKELKIQCEMSDKSKKSVSISRNTAGSVSKPTFYGASEFHLPVQEITQVLEGSSKEFKSWLLQHMKIEVDQEELKRICDDAGVPVDLIDLSDIAGTVQTQLDVAKEKVKRLADNIRSRAKTIEEFSQTIDPNVDLTAPEKYKELSAELSKFDSDCAKMESFQKEERRLLAQIDQIKHDAIPVKAKIDTIKQHPQLLPSKEEILANNVRADVIRIFELHEAIGQTENCMICDSKITEFSKRKSSLEEASADVGNKVELLKILADLESQYASMEKTIVELFEILGKLREDRNVLAQGLKSLDVEDVKHLRSKQETLKEKVNAVSVYKLKMQEIARVKEEHVKMQTDHKEAKRLVDALQTIQTEFVETAKEIFIDKINDALSFQIDIDVDEKSIDIGKREGGKLCFGLSGAEYLELKFALAQVIYPNNSLILSEDKAIDSERLVAIMEKFSTFSSQVILTTVVMPSTIPQDWTVIEL